MAAAADAFAVPTEGEQWVCQPSADGWQCRINKLIESPYGYAPRPLRAPGASRGPSDLEEADELSANMDWTPRRLLAPEQAASMPMQCSGAYVEPPTEPLTDATQIGTILARADESELSQNPEIASFSGNVTLRQDERRLRADTATYFREEDRVVIEGNVQYREPGLLLRGESAEFSTASETGTVSHAEFVMHVEHARGKADQIFRNADETVDLEDGTYTQCEPGQEDWRLAASEIHLDRESGRGIARSARLEVQEVPVLWTPYISFPIDDRRMSGFLWPAFTNSSQNGFDVALPYYLNLAPNYDATIIPRFLNDRGVMAGAEARYLNEWSEWAVSGSYLPDDDVYEDDRWLTNIQQTGRLNGTFKTQIDFTKVSDEEYLKNLSTTGLEVQRSTHLLQLAKASYRFSDDWSVSLKTQQYQVLDEDLREPYKMLPRIEVKRDWSNGVFEPDYSLTTEYTYFEHKDDFRLTGQRLYAEPSVGFPMEWMAGFIRPRLSYQYIGYSLDDTTAPGKSDSPSVSAPRVSLDTGIFLERETSWFGTDMQQTLEPRLFYLWSDFDDHSDIPNFDTSELTFNFNQLFRYTRFSGRDRIADANQTSASLTTRFIDRDSGIELMSASVGQIYYFEDRRVSASGSDRDIADTSNSQVAAELNINPSPSFRISGVTVWNPDTEQIDEAGASLNWTPGDTSIFNLSYRQREGDGEITDNTFDPYKNVDQIDFSTVFPLGDRWKFFGRYQYDIDNEDNLEEMAGVEYSSCCWSVRMVYQEGVDWNNGRDRGFYLQFVLRGLGGLGQNIDQLLDNSIFGYGMRNKENGIVY